MKHHALLLGLLLLGCKKEEKPKDFYIAVGPPRGATAEQILEAAKTGIIPPTFTPMESNTVVKLRVP